MLLNDNIINFDWVARPTNCMSENVKSWLPSSGLLAEAPFLLLCRCSVQRERAALRAPLPLLVLNSVLLLNEHYCCSGRAPLNSAGAPQAERSERAAPIPLSLCCLAWRHFGRGFRTDKVDIKSNFGLWISIARWVFSCTADFFFFFFLNNTAHEHQITPQVSFLQFVSHFNPFSSLKLR